uniref:Ribosome biogenesis protein SLX9 n=2 Tax=Schizophyllum commune (strain H4-8 / FGSC 9210) TaxID=578458 RepID=D8PKR6_SCHCM
MNEPAPTNLVKKKEKLQAKKEAFLQRLSSSHSPYSKSHERRLKRKAREQLASGMGEIQAVVDALEGEQSEVQTIGEAGADEQQSRPKSGKNGDQDSTAMNTTTSDEPKKKRKAKAGIIGEGRKEPLSKAQRKRALQAEKMRHPLILSNPSFAANPFKTIRTHAENTLEKHQAPAAGS